MKSFLCIALTLIPFSAMEMAPADSEADGDEKYFREQVDPILRQRCYHCHSHEASEISGGLTLDWKTGWQTGGDRGPAIVPGDPDRSLLIQAILHRDPDLQMPEERLPDKEIAVLIEWVRRGAFDPRSAAPKAQTLEEAADWWSLRPLVQPEIPVVVNADGLTNPVDRFLKSKLNEHQLKPREPADRRTLIRRLSVDLHGLHPSVQETQEFLADQSPDAVERLVDRLLNSPQYGERWARHWLDTIHYADTHGYEHDVLRTNAWRFRDYVIQSLNADKPWDRFVREQLAADVLYPGDSAAFPAIGFLGAGTYDHSAAATAVNAFENLDRDDMVSQTMSAFVSTTANCARCHAHKFDPISQEDYYSLQAVFAGIGKGEISFDADPNVAKQRRQWLQLQTAADQRDAGLLLHPDQEFTVAMWEQQKGPSANWQPVDVHSYVSVEGATLVRNDDGSILSAGTRPEKETTVLTVSTSLKTMTAFRLDVLPDASLPQNGPGRTDNGNLHLSEFEVQMFVHGATEPRRLAFRKASADFDQEGWTSSHAIDGNPATAWGIYPQVGRPHFAVFELSESLEVEPNSHFVIQLRQFHGGGHIIGRFHVSVTDSDAVLTTAIPADVEQILQTEASDRNPEQRLTLNAYVIRNLAASHLLKLPPPELLYAAATTAKNERGVITFSEPRTIRILRRGDLDKPGEEVGPGALSAVLTLPARFEVTDPKNESLRRAALADWIAHHDNPLTWRSIVNRVWQYHFGKGLCDTPGDFGRMGGIPSHPELLDWLAVWFRDDAGGSLKSLHRLIVTSDAYRQSSAHDAEAAAVDTENRLLWKMNRSRLDADSLRDSIMAVSGELDLTMGGPGVAHFLSSPGPQLTPVLDYESFDWNSPGANRRSIYRIVWRGIQDPFMEAWDFPDMGQLSPTRGTSTSPLQALVLWNNNFVLHHAEKFAARIQSHGATVDEQLISAVRICWLRDPSPDELVPLKSLATQHGLPAACRILLNSSEFLFVE